MTVCEGLPMYTTFYRPYNSSRYTSPSVTSLPIFHRSPCSLRSTYLPPVTNRSPWYSRPYCKFSHPLFSKWTRRIYESYSDPMSMELSLIIVSFSLLRLVVNGRSTSTDRSNKHDYWTTAPLDEKNLSRRATETNYEYLHTHYSKTPFFVVDSQPKITTWPTNFIK